MTDRNIDTNRRRVLRGAGLAGAATLAGCMGGGGGGNQKADSITAWGWDVAAESLKITAGSYQEDTDATVNVKQIGRSDLKDKYKSKLLAGSGAPAVSMMESVDAAAWVDTGGLKDVSGYLSDEVKGKFVSGKWGPLEKDGKTYALPWDIGPVGTFYRKDVLDEHDVNVGDVETWEQFIEEGKKLPDDVAMLNIPSNDYDGLWRMQYRQLGGQPFTEDGKIAFDNEKSVRVARNLKRLRDAGITASEASWSSAWFSGFQNGSIASLSAGAWMEGTLKSELPDTSGKWRVMRPPAFESGGARATNWGGSNLVIADQISDAKANRAWDYMEYSLASKENQVKMYEEYGIFPAYEPAYQSDAFDQGSEFLGGQSAGRMFAEIAPDIPPYRYTIDTPEVTKAINTHFRKMMNGDVSPKKAVANAAKQVADRTDRELA
ncbi:extracellular solute-binding protein [Halorussus sp. MSC15.2]|nr:extracellular solute-binding protein [Halorussus sp. MSC15.2]